MKYNQLKAMLAEIEARNPNLSGNTEIYLHARTPDGDWAGTVLLDKDWSFRTYLESPQHPLSEELRNRYHLPARKAGATAIILKGFIHNRID